MLRSHGPFPLSFPVAHHWCSQAEIVERRKLSCGKSRRVVWGASLGCNKNHMEFGFTATIAGFSANTNASDDGKRKIPRRYIHGTRLGTRKTAKTIRHGALKTSTAQNCGASETRTTFASTMHSARPLKLTKVGHRISSSVENFDRRRHALKLARAGVGSQKDDLRVPPSGASQSSFAVQGHRPAQSFYFRRRVLGASIRCGGCEPARASRAAGYQFSSGDAHPRGFGHSAGELCWTRPANLSEASHSALGTRFKSRQHAAVSLARKGEAGPERGPCVVGASSRGDVTSRRRRLTSHNGGLHTASRPSRWRLVLSPREIFTDPHRACPSFPSPHCEGTRVTAGAIPAPFLLGRPSRPTPSNATRVNG